MSDTEERIKELEEEIQKTPKNKATEKHISKLRARVAKLKNDIETMKSKKSGRKTTFKKSGDATVSIVGFPNVGKSTLINNLTSAKSEVGDYQFTTLDLIPGIMDHKGARIQLVDLPGLIEDAAKGRGRGREVISTVRTSDLVIFMFDIYQTDFNVLVKELENANIRLNQKPPNITIKKKSRGGITMSSTARLKNKDLLLDIMREWGFVNADVVVREELTPERLVDHLAGNRTYLPSISIINKTDLASAQELRGLMKRFPEAVFISAKDNVGMDQLRDEIFHKLEFIRVYLRPQGKTADLNKPLILIKDSKVEDVCKIIHRDFKEKFRYAQVWGKSAKFKGQRIGLDHGLNDKDVITIVIRK
ncbi:MAG: GTP-binding protein [Thermoplasmata archaeon]|nr:GTP-binding protein [Thermoplasmata archaeon]